MGPDIAALRARATELAQGWNVSQDIVLAAMYDSGGAVPGGSDSHIRGIDVPYFHKVAHSRTGTQITFFDEAASTFRCNLGNGRFEAQTVFALENIGIDLRIGYDRDGAAGSQVAPVFSDTGATLAIRGVAEEAKRKALETGLLELKRAQETIGIWQLSDLPAGNGLNVAVGSAGTVATSAGGIYTTNGAAFPGSKRQLGRGRYLLAGGDQISARILLPAAADTGANVNCFWNLQLFGRTYRRGT